MISDGSTSERPEPGATLVGCDLGKSPLSFRNAYEMVERLRSGAYGTVYVVKPKHPDHMTNEVYAVKQIQRATGSAITKKKKDDEDAVHREVQILHDLSELTGITRLVDYFVKPEVFHIVQTYAAGGDVFDLLAKRTHYNEKDMRDLASSLLDTMSHIHGRGIVHRDLKPENLLLKERDNDSSVLVADFGFARYIPTDPLAGGCKTRCGTPAFVAPEVLMGKPYDTRVDMWSVGCLMYMLLSGYPPFNDKSHRGLFRKIKAGDYVFHTKTFANVSVSVKQLISGFLTVDPKYRTTAEQALIGSTWIHELDDKRLLENDLSASLSEIKSFSAKRKFRSIVHVVMFSMQYKTFLVKTDKNPKAFDEQMKEWEKVEKDAKEGKTTEEEMTTSTGHMDVDTTDDKEKKGPVSATKRQTNFRGTTNMRPSKLNEYYIGQDLLISQVTKTDFKKNYTLLSQINEGSAGKVWECVKNDDATETKYAVKIIPKINRGKPTEESVLKEVAVMQNLDQNKHIVKLLDFFEGEDHFYLVMDLMVGGDVFDRIVEKYQYTEKDARDLTRILLTAVDYIHEEGFTHRDLKPQNLLLTSEHDDADIKIADFGAACRVHAPQTITTRCGTPTYVAPEILKNIPYDQSADMWSVGVIIFVLLCGYPPFMEDNQALLFTKIRCGDWYFEEEDWKTISDDAKQLLTGLLQPEPQKRLTAKQALQSKWLRDSDEELNKRDLAKTLETMIKRRARFKTLAKSLIGMGGFRKSLINRQANSGEVEDMEKRSIQEGGTVVFPGMKAVETELRK